MSFVGLKLNRSEPGVWVSGGTHAALLAAGIFAFAAAKLPDAEEGIPVEVVTENQLSEITRGETTAKAPQPEPKPRVDRVAEKVAERDPGEAKRDVPSPPTRPAEMKVAEEPAEATPPPPPPIRPIETVKPEPKPTPPKREDLARLVEQEEAEIRAKAEAEAKVEAESKAKAEAERQKKLAEEKAKQVAEAKARAEKARADAEAKAKRQAELAEKFNPGDIARILSSREPAQSSGATGREVQRTASLGTATGSAQRLNPSQRDALMGLLRDQLHRCWQAPIGAQGAPKPPVPSVRVKLKEDGSLAASPAVINTSSDPLFPAVAESATRATRRCSPLRIPAQFAPYYQDWKDLVVNFDPRDLG